MQWRNQESLFSYSRKDSDFALRLSKDLRNKGVNLWVDQLDVELGDNWDDTIEEALNSCNVLLLILSPTSVASKNVKDEIAFALDENKRIVPVLYQTCKIPLRIRRLQRSDFTRDYANGLKQVLAALGQTSELSYSKPKVETLSHHEQMQSIKVNRPVVSLRSKPLRRRINDEEIKEMLLKYGFFCEDHGWNHDFSNPSGTGSVTHHFEKAKIKNNDVVIDHETSLIWQRSGSRERMPWPFEERILNKPEGKLSPLQYVKDLNDQRYANGADWRLPTLEEGLSLVTPIKLNKLYLDEEFFDGCQKEIWIADGNISSGMYINFAEGHCGKGIIHDLNATGFYVRAVRSGH